MPYYKCSTCEKAFSKGDQRRFESLLKKIPVLECTLCEQNRIREEEEADKKRKREEERILREQQKEDAKIQYDKKMQFDEVKYQREKEKSEREKEKGERLHEKQMAELKIKEEEQKAKKEHFKLEQQRIQRTQNEDDIEFQKQTKYMELVKDIMIQSLSISDKQDRDEFLAQFKSISQMAIEK